MVKSLRLQIFVGILIITSLFGLESLAVIRTFLPVGTSGNWSKAANWSPVGIPDPGDQIVVPSLKNCTLDIDFDLSGSILLGTGSVFQTSADLALLPGSTFSMDPSSSFSISGQELKISGLVSFTGVITVNESTKLIVENFNGPLPKQSQSSIGELTILGTSDVSLDASMKLNNALSISSSSVLRVHGFSLASPFLSDRILFSAGPGGSTFELTGSGYYTLPALQLKSLLLSRTGNVELNGNLELADKFTVGPTTIVSGTPSLTSIVPFTGTSITFLNQNRFEAATPNLSIMLGPTGTFQNNGTYRLFGNMVCNGSFTNNGIFHLDANHLLTVNGSVSTGPGSVFNPSRVNSKIVITVDDGDNWNNAGEFNAGDLAQIRFQSDSPTAFVNSGNLNLETNLQILDSDGIFENSGILSLADGNGFYFTGSGNPLLKITRTLECSELVVNKTEGTVLLLGPEPLVILDQISVLSGELDINHQPVVLKSGPDRTARIGQIIGVLSNADQVTMQRYVAGSNSAWYFMGTPILGQSFNDWTDDFEIKGPFPEASVATTADRSTMFVFDGADSPTGSQTGEVNGWRIPLTSDVQPGKGYRSFLKSSFLTGPRIFDNTGEIIQGDFDFQPEFNLSGYGGGGWNFLSNPYPSQIDWVSPGWTKTNIGAAIYVWNGQTGQYGAYNFLDDITGTNTGTNGVTNMLASGQAFFVKATASGPELRASEMVKSSDASSFLRHASGNSGLLRITLANSSGYTDENVIRFHAEGSQEFDPAQDALKLTGSTLNLSSLTPDGTRLCISTVPEIGDNTLIIPLTANSFTQGSLQLRFSDFGEEVLNSYVSLFDSYTNQVHYLQEGSVVSFTVNSNPDSQKPGRFQLIFTKVQEFHQVLANNATTITAYQRNAGEGRLSIRVQNSASQKGNLRILQIDGKELFKESVSLTNSESADLPWQLNPGLYFVEWSENGKTISTKAIIPN
ncbi:MAG TPA: hypothetical protein PK509_01325 [Catalimonadaceae bacterium]|nr:hypothetical protein [Catalimonadaceae bacterium]HPI11368.1 hypothetical protein [Catalimonadaceae bacterium]